MSSANDKLCDAAKSGDVAEIERQIAAGADPNALDGTAKRSPLHWAADGGHLAAIDALLKAGARLDGASSSGVTPLMEAAISGNTTAVNALVAAGADVRCANKRGDTALHRASMRGDLDAARMLVEAGARADVRNRDGYRPIDMVRATLACSVVVAA
jgi:ankyrin repeat protein